MRTVAPHMLGGYRAVIGVPYVALECVVISACRASAALESGVSLLIRNHLACRIDEVSDVIHQYLVVVAYAERFAERCPAIRVHDSEAEAAGIEPLLSLLPQPFRNLDSLLATVHFRSPSL